MKIMLVIVGLLASLFSIGAGLQFIDHVTQETNVPTIAMDAFLIGMGLFVASVCFHKAVMLARGKNTGA